MKCAQIILILFIFLSCQDSAEEEVNKAIRIARAHLTNDDCTKAIKVLDDFISSESDNVRFVQTLTSAYACRSDFSEIVLLADDLSLMNASSGNFIASLTLFGSSPRMDSVNNQEYLYLQEALEYIQRAGFGTSNPTAASRSIIFGATGANNIHLQMLLMTIVQLGKYYYYYGNADPATGAKGGGAGANNCLIAYTDASAQAAINTNFPDNKGSCSIPATGHPDLPIGTPATSIPRLCESLIVFNNMLDLLSVISFGSGDFDDELGNINTPIDALFTATDGGGFPQIRTVSDLRIQSDCETYGLANPDHIQQYFAMIIESVFQ